MCLTYKQASLPNFAWFFGNELLKIYLIDKNLSNWENKKSAKSLHPNVHIYMYVQYKSGTYMSIEQCNSARHAVIAIKIWYTVLYMSIERCNSARHAVIAIKIWYTVQYMSIEQCHSARHAVIAIKIWYIWLGCSWNSPTVAERTLFHETEQFRSRQK